MYMICCWCQPVNVYSYYMHMFRFCSMQLFSVICKFVSDAGPMLCLRVCACSNMHHISNWCWLETFSRQCAANIVRVMYAVIIANIMNDNHQHPAKRKQHRWKLKGIVVGFFFFSKVIEKETRGFFFRWKSAPRTQSALDSHTADRLRKTTFSHAKKDISKEFAQMKEFKGTHKWTDGMTEWKNLAAMQTTKKKLSDNWKMCRMTTTSECLCVASKRDIKWSFKCSN